MSYSFFKLFYKKVEEFTGKINNFHYLEKSLSLLRSNWYSIKEPEKILWS